MCRKLSILLAVLFIAVLPACGRKPVDKPQEPITLFPPHSETEFTQAASPPRSTQSMIANKTYGETKKQKPVGWVTDYSETFRSESSYALEPTALAAAKKMFAATVSMPETLQVLDTQVFGCADDGENVYYMIYFFAAYRVETGEEIRRSVNFNVGVRQSDQKTFDATQSLSDVMERYSIYSETIVTDEIPQTDDAPDFEQAAMQYAVLQLKDPSTGHSVRAARRDDLCEEPSLSVYDVLCVGVNDYGAEIPCVYTVYMTYKNHTILQLDPMQILK